MTTDLNDKTTSDVSDYQICGFLGYPTIYGHTILGQNLLLLLCNSKMCYYDHVILDAETKTETFTYDVEPNEIPISSKDFDQVAFGYDPEAERSTSPSAFLLGTNDTGSSNNQSTVGNSCAVEANKGLSQVALFETLESMNPEFSDVACDLIDEFDILKDYNPADYPADIAG